MKKRKKIELNPKQERFCQLYAGGGEFCSNGVWSYILAFELTKKVPLIAYSSLTKEQERGYQVAKVNASNLLTIPNVKARCDEILDALIKDENVDRELARVIMQNEELSAKVSAIKEYNAVKNRIKQPIIQVNISKTLDALENET